MNAIIKHLAVGVICLLLSLSAFGQGSSMTEERRIDALETRLDEYAMKHPKIKTKKVDLDLSATLDELAIAVTRESKLSLTVHPEVKGNIKLSLSEAPIYDILLYLCKAYSLTLDFSGSIIELKPYEKPEEIVQEKVPQVDFIPFSNSLSMDLKRDTLDRVLKEISQKTGKNVIAGKEVAGMEVSGFIGKTDFEDALEQLALRNNLELIKSEKGYWQLLKSSPEPKPGSAPKPRGRNTGKSAPPSGFVKLEIQGDTILSLEVKQGKLSEIIEEVSDKLGKDYYLYTEMPETITLRLKNTPYENFLDRVLKGTSFEFRKEDGIYLIGDSFEDDLYEAKMVQLQHRSVNEILSNLPEDLTKTDIKVKEFVDLNSLLITGRAQRIEKFVDFIEELDRPVPVVMIEMLILDVNKSRGVETGIQAGIAPEPVQSGGTLFPGLDFTFSADGINGLLNLLAGNGIVNLGQVSPNFYMSLKAVESSGLIRVRQKPRLSTLNGHTANFTNGETRYYVNEQTNTTGSLSPVITQNRQFEAVEANFTVDITPYVSGDENVTMDIKVDQASFVGQLLPDAPPPTVNRSLDSKIRVKNGEMIVLGGLESTSLEDSGSGVPILQRIPVIKWFFSSRNKRKTKTKLLIFVKPTIVYE